MLPAGSVLNDRYRIEKVLGKGGMGAVYLATHLQLEETVAVKELNPPQTAPADMLAICERQFRVEARILNRLRHPNLPRVYDFFELEGGLYLVMDFIPGDTLMRVVQDEGAVTAEQSMEWARQLCDVLRYLHTQEPPVIFRDLKPDNIMLEPNGTIRLIDFGIAKVFDADKGASTETVLRAATHGFAAPEQYGEGGTDARADIYSLGATLYSVLTMRIPPSSIMMALGEEELDPLGSVREDLDPSFLTTIDWMMQLRKELRPPSIADVQEALGFTTRMAGSQVAVPLQIRRLIREEFHHFFPSTEWFEHDSLLVSATRALQVQGTMPMVALLGEVGLGKSRLLRLVYDRMADMFIAMKPSVASPVARHQPFGVLLPVFSAWLAEHMAEVQDALLRLDVQELQEAAQAMPELRALTADARPMALRGPVDRARSVMAVLLLVLEHLSTRGTVLLALDDMQYADEATMKLFDTVRMGAMSTRVALLMAIDDTGQTSPCRVFVDRWASKGDLTAITLPALGRFDLASYLEAVLPPLSGLQTRLDDLLACTHGNPLLLEEIVRFLIVRRLLAEHNGVITLDDFPAHVLPRTIEDTIRRRREYITIDTQRILGQAAAIGKQFELRTLLKLSSDGVSAVVDALTEACRALFLIEEERGRYQFTSEPTRRVFYDCLTGAQRTQLHRKLGTMEERRATQAGVEPNAGYHFEQAGDVDKSLEMLARLSQDIQSPRKIEVLVGDAIKLKGFKDTLSLSEEQVKAGLTALGMLIRSMRSLETYGAKSPITTTSFGTALTVIRSLVDGRGTLGYSMSEEAFHINQNEVPLDQLPGGVKVMLNRHKISGFEFQPGATEQELRDFVDLLLMSRDGIQAMGGWSAACASRNVTHIVINEIVYIGVAEKDLFDTHKLKSADEVIIKTTSGGTLTPLAAAEVPAGAEAPQTGEAVPKLDRIDDLVKSLSLGEGSSDVLLSKLDRLREVLEDIKRGGAVAEPVVPVLAEASEPVDAPEAVHELLRQARVEDILRLVSLMNALDVPLKTFLDSRPEILLRGIEHPDPTQRTLAAMGLMHMGKASRKHLLQYLRSSDNLVGRATAVFLLLRSEVDLGMMLAREVLACISPEESVRLLHAMQLADLPWALPLATLLISPSRGLRRAALQCLLDARLPEVIKVEFLQSALQSEHPSVMEDAIAALGEVSDEASVNALVTLAQKVGVQEGGAKIRILEQICHTLGRIGLPKAMPFLRGVLKKGLLTTAQDPVVRAAALLALRNIPGDEAKELVKKHGNDPQANVGFTARHMLLKDAPPTDPKRYDEIMRTLETEGLPEVSASTELGS